MRYPNALLLAPLLAALATACEQPTPVAEPAPDEPAAANTDADTFDVQAYCSTVCERATACGIREAQARAGGSTEEREALQRANREAAALTRSCIDGCKTEAPAADSAKERALICYRREDCGELRSCLEAL
jgi:hypothetical protein